MMYCENCLEAVEPEWIDDQPEVGWHGTPTCPMCGAELEDEAVKCLCGSWKGKHDDACPECREMVKAGWAKVINSLMNVGFTKRAAELTAESIIAYE